MRSTASAVWASAGLVVLTVILSVPVLILLGHAAEGPGPVTPDQTPLTVTVVLWGLFVLGCLAVAVRAVWRRSPRLPLILLACASTWAVGSFLFHLALSAIS